MPPDTLYGVAFFATVGWLSLLYVVIFRPSRMSASRSRRYYRAPSKYEDEVAPRLGDVGRQLQTVMNASFERRRLLNWGEYKVFNIIQRDIAAARQGYRVFAQTNLGEFLASPGNDDAFHSINSKRVDILIVDRGGWPVLAIEYQGSGHYQGTAAARDAVKKEALRRAGVRYVEVSERDSAEQIRSRVREQLGCETVL